MLHDQLCLPEDDRNALPTQPLGRQRSVRHQRSSAVYNWPLAEGYALPSNQLLDDLCTNINSFLTYRKAIKHAVISHLLIQAILTYQATTKEEQMDIQKCLRHTTLLCTAIHALYNSQKLHNSTKHYYSTSDGIT